jgi:hypothetical protein
MEQIWPIVLRAIERCIIYAGAILLVWLGYMLFKRGISKGRGDLKAKSKIGEIIFSGTGPGLFFMAFGAITLMVGLLTGTVRITFEPIDQNYRRIREIQYGALPKSPYDTLLKYPTLDVNYSGAQVLSSSKRIDPNNIIWIPCSLNFDPNDIIDDPNLIKEYEGKKPDL